MPRIEPLNEVVSWPHDEGTLGIIGVAPWATLSFLEILYGLIPAQKDWHYPRVLVDVNTKLPSRGRYFELGERDPSPYIHETIRELAEQGATAVAVPCNTAHLLYDSWAADAPIPVVDIVASVVDCFADLEPGSQVTVLASDSIRRHGLYSRALCRQGLEEMPMSDAEQQVVATAISEVKQSGEISVTTLEKIHAALHEQQIRGTEGIIIGCTELAALQAAGLQYAPLVVESNRALAVASLRAIGVSQGI